MIYSAAHKKSESTRSTPSTPRKSARLSSNNKDTTTTNSYADAAAEPPAMDGLTSATPRRTRTAVLVNGESIEGSPRRMTRSRSKGMGLGSDVE